MTAQAAKVDKRETERNRRRIQVRYGPGQAKHLGYTCDLAEHGLFLQGNRTFPPGTHLQLSIAYPDGQRERQGIVRWIKSVPPAFRQSTRGGMGVEVLDDE